jgi:hypothetical protein
MSENLNKSKKNRPTVYALGPSEKARYRWKVQNWHLMTDIYRKGNLNKACKDGYKM